MPALASMAVSRVPACRDPGISTSACGFDLDVGVAVDGQMLRAPCRLCAWLPCVAVRVASAQIIPFGREADDTVDGVGRIPSRLC